ncbi:OLC1v1016360C1 [Oldenlandia corymbosa var. corymbosa]|uniref:OLC1v1016360C1 n=1 Tax=Oldenlandia corymbosa var. corymbosa TaxID=529605 RepID=A0AAV1E6X1_OLDCO|nr:OLC1v1016360C1 [Oldenlandia corymbosa var. corymbosa]
MIFSDEMGGRVEGIMYNDAIDMLLKQEGAEANRKLTAKRSPQNFNVVVYFCLFDFNSVCWIYDLRICGVEGKGSSRSDFTRTIVRLALNFVA